MTFSPKTAVHVEPKVTLEEELTPSQVMEFEFGRDLILQCQKIVADSIASVQKSKSFFKEKTILDRAKHKSQKDGLSEDVMAHPAFESMLSEFFYQHEFIALDGNETLTTPDHWNKESAIIHISGEETDDHVLDEDLVDRALRDRCWVNIKGLPATLVLAYRQKGWPEEKGGWLHTKPLVELAGEMGYEVFGAQLTWNRLWATGLMPQQCGTFAEFTDAILESERAQESWFVRPTVFLCDDWQHPDAKRFAEFVLNHSQMYDEKELVLANRGGISDEQVAAVIAATFQERLVTVIEGTAGAGKSFTMKSVCEAYEQSGYQILGLAVSWTAAKVLGGSTGLPDENCRALEGVLIRMNNVFNQGTDYFEGPTLILVDEAGMVGVEQMYKLLHFVKRSKHKVKVVLTGDSLQVAPVDAGNALQAIIEFHGTTRIDAIRRQKQESHRSAVKRFSEQRSGEALFPFVHQEAVEWCEDLNDTIARIVQHYISYRNTFPDKKALVLAYTNKDVLDINRRIRQVYKKAGILEANEVEIEVTDGREKFKAGFSVGDEVVLRSNDANLATYFVPKPGEGAYVYDESTWRFKSNGVFNRNAGRIVGIRRARFPVGSFDFIIDLGGELPSRIMINSQQFRHQNGAMPMVHNYGTTIYASQGQTVEKVFLMDAQQLDFRLSYVAMSRHTESVEIYLNQTDLHLRLDRELGKSSSKSTRGVDRQQLATQLGRYTRKEMLQEVAKVWGKDADNLTAVVFERWNRLGRPKNKNKPKDYAMLKRSSKQDVVLDFIPETNVRYPLIDIAKILELPDPVGDGNFVRASDVELHRQAAGQKSPVEVLPQVKTPRFQTHKPLPIRQGMKMTPGTAWDGSADWMNGADELGLADEVKERLKKQAEKMQVEKPIHPFLLEENEVVKVDINDVGAKTNAKRFGDLLGQLKEEALKLFKTDEANLNPKIKETQLPVLPLDPLVGAVLPDGTIDFSQVPQTRVPEGSTQTREPSIELLKQTRTLWWDVGRGQELRVLARDFATGEVLSRFDFKGACVVGDGYPPIVFNPTRRQDFLPEMHIVPGVKEWFLMQEYYDKKYAERPSERPWVALGCPDADWGLVLNHLKGPGKKVSKVVIVRSKYDEQQLPWALSLQNELRKRWKLDTDIVPSPQASLALEDLHHFNTQDPSEGSGMSVMSVNPAMMEALGLPVLNPGRIQPSPTREEGFRRNPQKVGPSIELTHQQVPAKPLNRPPRLK